MKFSYSGYDKAGKTVSGVCEGTCIEEATEQLRRQGTFVVSIAEGKGDKASAPKRQTKARRKKASPKQIAQFSRELAVLVSTGTPIADAIESLEKQAENDQWRDVVGSVRRHLEDGDAFSEALESRPEIFDAVFVSLVAAGESSGQLDKMLNRLAMLTRRQAHVRSSVIAAMMYPLLLTMVCLAVLVLMLGVVLPRFSGLFETLDTPLPASTQVLVAISELMIGYWWLALPALLVAGWTAAWWLRTPPGKRTLERALLRAPKVGDIVRSFGTARVARILGTLLDAKVPMIEAIGLTRRSVSHHGFKELLDRAERGVTKGDPVSTAFIESDLFIASSAQAVRNGEQTGRMSEVLVHIADYLDEENESTVKALSSLLEPLIMVVLGGLVAFVAVSMFLPLFDLTASAGGAP
ncbi:MAG: type II secretion system F family protein [Phycisphaerales bacterium]|nr:type II secretion system F family protein [Planctomycetota bacterium]MCH8507793.1 type II secretion system F family protein [Phycisphaerales bacterium]